MAKSKQVSESESDGFLSLEQNTSASVPKLAQATNKKSRKQQQHQSSQDDNAAQPSGSSRVIYLGNLPHGFYEKELLGYFSQFGKLTRVRLSRNKKTGKAKHYAFLEFQHPDVARIVSDAMDGYFMFSQRLSCKLMRPEQVHPLLFKGANHKFRNIPWRKLERQRHDKELTPEEHARRVARRIKKDNKRQARIKEAGIDYEYTGLKSQLPVQSKRTKLE
ncbi:hypothetical protein DUNSADRAFT_13242 [Dunaliella salina]|uniref:RRM domain-containing protein n=1 Tax=Dunaliella salina TaxID=3046 RepID=A0ABQ7H3D2_DUNSA|nr:hypothetical protein DUNSADRAFT_13242 [Dunaliella salina]|eukprot:KAF5841374.1 hypothetical protein DUNSADRAFT_13242 [Dunaliella salina]